MKIFTEQEGMTRRQFVKGTGILFVSAVITGVFAKFGFEAYHASKKYIEKRAQGLYTLDEKMAIRKSHLNPEVIDIYEQFLSPGKVDPVSEKAYHLLHTKYGNDVPALISKLEKYKVA